jgi:hypothetical protein
MRNIRRVEAIIDPVGELTLAIMHVVFDPARRRQIFTLVNGAGPAFVPER